jgi:ABC-type sugar transport system permease subunit
VNESTPSRSKVAALLLTLVGLTGLSCLFLYALIRVSEASFRDYLGSRPLPALTTFCLDFRLAILLLPIPWLAAAVWLIGRTKTSAFSMTAFTSTLLITLLSAAIVVIVGLAFPWLPIRIGLNPR